MKRLFDAADDYLNECDWIDMALIKVCLCAIGVMIGLCIPKKHKKCYFAAAMLVFIATYIPLMAKFIPFLTGKMEKMEQQLEDVQ